MLYLKFYIIIDKIFIYNTSFYFKYKTKEKNQRKYLKNLLAFLLLMLL